MHPASLQPRPHSTEDAVRAGSACAVVVTHNRKALLRECIAALLVQSKALTHIVVVDNASTDGTQEMLRNEFPQVEILALTANAGGAGGFHIGLKWAYDRGHDWLWLLDDDTIAQPSALEQLFDAYSRFEDGKRPRLLVSKVVWTDGSLHTMNQPLPKFSDLEKLSLSVEHATLSIRSTTFVSCLIRRDLVARYGFPVADYFIWGDDTEFTARVLRENFGVLVPSSVVVHKTLKKHTALDAAPERYAYHVRNTVWMLRHSAAWTGKEKLRNAVTLAAWIWRYLGINGFSVPAIRGVLVGFKRGLFSAPRLRDLSHLLHSAQ